MDYLALSRVLAQTRLPSKYVRLGRPTTARDGCVLVEVGSIVQGRGRGNSGRIGTEVMIDDDKSLSPTLARLSPKTIDVFGRLSGARRWRGRGVYVGRQSYLGRYVSRRAGCEAG